MPQIISYCKNPITILLVFATVILLAVSSSTHQISSEEYNATIAKVRTTGDDTYGSVKGPNTVIHQQRNVGARYPFMASYYMIRSAEFAHTIGDSLLEYREKKDKRDRKLQKLVDEANNVPKHTRKFHPSAITNAGSRYKSWLAADRSIKKLDSPRAYAVSQIDERGWSMKQWACLDRLWWHESNWRFNAGDPSGKRAYGIPQAAPGNKMSSAGSDWRTNPSTQIDWGLDYIENRYQTPCQAWDFWANQSAFGQHGWGWY